MDITENELKVNSLNELARQESFTKFLSSITDLKNKFQVPSVLTKDDLLHSHKNQDHLIGTTVLSDPPIPNNYKKAFELFKNYYATFQLERQKHLFEEGGNSWNEANIKDVIEEIELWISETKNIKWKDCRKNINGYIQNSHSSQHEYLRLANGFYEGYLMSYEQCSESSTAAIVYGRYFLFYEYLKERLKELQPPAITDQPNELQPQIDKLSNSSNDEKKESINQFNKLMPIELAVNHFKVFTNTNYKKEKIPFLSNEAFELFIQKAFYEKKEIAKQKLNVGPTEKSFIVKRFYEFYQIGIGANADSPDYEGTTQCRQKYIELLTDNFTNWTFEDIKKNFGNKTKRKWEY